MFLACLSLVVGIAGLSACNFPNAAAELFVSPTATTRTPTMTQSPTITRTATASETATITSTSTRTSTPSPTLTITLTPTITNTPTRTVTITPTPEIRGRVSVQSNCRYGPGSAYLYEWGLYPANRVTVLNRNEDATWVYVDPWTYMDYCWVKADLLEFDGDITKLDIRVPILPASDLYGPVSNVRASRVNGDVWIAWDGIWMTEDDYRGYLIEIWVCEDGELRFKPIHSDGFLVVVQDDPDCVEESRGRVYAAEKHGYTRWVAIAWPPHPTATPPKKPSE